MEDLNIEQYAEKELHDKFSLWMLRIIIKLNGINELIDSRGYISRESIANFLGLGKYIDKEVCKNEILTILKEKHSKLENKTKLCNSNILDKNIEKISSLMQLNSYEKQILEFTILLEQYDILYDVIRFLGTELNSYQVKKYLSVILDIPFNEIEKSLSSDSKLIKSSLITFYKRNTQDLKNKLEFLSDDFADNMLSFDEDIEFMIKEIVCKCRESELKLDDFNHLEKNTSILLPYLKDSLEKKQKGVNILFYGAPGTGKTELTKVLSKHLNKTLFEISYCDEDDEPIDGKKRLNAYKSAQALLANKDVLFMFDEIEDVFNNDSNLSRRQENKAWINRILENNTIPTFWITNNVHSIDSAIIRRFDLAIELPIPKKKKRIEVLKKTSNGIISEKTITKLAKSNTIAPALVSRALKVVSSLDTQDPDKAFKTVINNTLKAQGYMGIKSKKKEKNKDISLPNTYDPSFINSSVDLQKLSHGIKTSQNARICLYGPAGTGKSAYGKYIAKELNKKLIIKKGSDLLSMYVGGTEENIARAFKEAKDKKAVLVFDEVDSFLADRTEANQSWEVTQVNEMLVQMENFDGVFIATTNLMNNLDKASLRRFDLKLEFSFLEKEQAWRLFKSECKYLGIKRVDSNFKKDLELLKYLTPGDFTAVIRQNRFNPIKSASDFIERLENEVEVKNIGNNKSMGFL